jgi:transposase
MAKPYSIDIRNRVIKKHEEGKKVTEIADELSVKKSFVYNMLNLYEATGSVEPKPHTGGKKTTIDEDMLSQIEALVLETPDITLQEIKDALARQTHESQFQASQSPLSPYDPGWICEI